MLQILAVVAFVAIAIGLPIFMVRGVISMYRDKDRTGTFSSGLAAVITELDRVVQPSVQHVEEVKDDKREENSIGGE